MSAYDSPMTVGKMPNGQPCIRLPRGLVATMEAGSDAARDADAAEVARRWNTHADLLAALTLWAGIHETTSRFGIVPHARIEQAMDRTRAAIARATGGDK